MPQSMGAPTASGTQSAPGNPVPPMAGVANAGEPKWVVPQGWTRLPDQQMRYATFSVDPADSKLNVVVYNFGPESGQLLPNVNRWEQQIGATPSQLADLPKVVTHIHSNGLEIDSVDIAAPAAAGQADGTRMLAAIIPTGEQVWFLKFVGPTSKIAAKKTEYDAFLKSISFGGAPATTPAVPPGHPPIGGAMPAMPPMQPAPAGANPPVANPPVAGKSAIAVFKSYDTPASWALDPQDRPMRVATFHITDGTQQADLIISALPANAFGTPEANINRWRGQVGLGPIIDPKTVERTPVNVGGGDGLIFDFTGAEQRLIVAQVTFGTNAFFFKLIGPTKMIETQKKSFDAFLKSVQFAAE